MADQKALLAIIFNHRFEQNVPKLEAYYGPRFSLRRYIIPFAPKPSAQIIRVAENGFTFSGHIGQATEKLLVPGVTHYVFAGDDLIVNPRLNEANLASELKLDENTGFIKSLAPVDNLRYAWAWAARTTAAMRTTGFDYKRELPSADVALQRFEAMGLHFHPPAPRGLQDVGWTLRSAFKRQFVVSVLYNLIVTGRKTPYPLLSGYSDFVVVPAKAMQKFGEYCSVFAAMNLFAEVAVPTALALACDRVQTELQYGEHFMEKTAVRRADFPYICRELWGQDIEQLAAQYGLDWDRLIADYPANQLYIHPVKLSKWQSKSGALAT